MIRSDYFCDFCEHEFPYHKLVPFNASAGELTVSTCAAEGEHHLCAECIEVIAKARGQLTENETILG